MGILDSAAFSRQRLRRSQRRSRVAFLLVLFTLLMSLVVVASLFSSGQTSSLEWSTRDQIHLPIQMRDRRISFPQSQSEYLYRREISVWDYQQVQEYYDQVEQEQKETEAASLRQDWTEEQLDEMERYYKRYLNVFVETHGDQYQPESKEVVYAEYLKFLDQKAKGKADKKTSAQTRPVQSEKPPRENSLNQGDVEGPSDVPHNASTTTMHDPIYLETDWEEFNELGGDRLKQANRTYTETVRMARV